jgi:hypothetical protein
VWARVAMDCDDYLLQFIEATGSSDNSRAAAVAATEKAGQSVMHRT